MFRRCRGLALHRGCHIPDSPCTSCFGALHQLLQFQCKQAQGSSLCDIAVGSLGWPTLTSNMCHVWVFKSQPIPSHGPYFLSTF